MHNVSNYAQSCWTPQSQEIESLTDIPVLEGAFSSIEEPKEIFSEQAFVTGITNIRDKISEVTTVLDNTIDRSEFRSMKSAFNFLKGPEEERAGLAKELENLVDQSANSSLSIFLLKIRRARFPISP